MLDKLQDLNFLHLFYFWMVVRHGGITSAGERLHLTQPTISTQIRKLEKSNYSRFNWFQKDIAYGRPNNWRCRAGARYLYICEDGLVHYCSQQRGYPAKPLDQYTVEDIRREYATEKGCAPFCTVSCVHQISYFDEWRNPQTIPATEPQQPEPKSDLVQLG